MKNCFFLLRELSHTSIRCVVQYIQCFYSIQKVLFSPSFRVSLRYAQNTMESCQCNYWLGLQKCRKAQKQAAFFGSLPSSGEKGTICCLSSPSEDDISRKCNSFHSYILRVWISANLHHFRDNTMVLYNRCLSPPTFFDSVIFPKI